MEVKTACKYLDDYKAELVLTADPVMIDKIVCQTDRIPPKVIRILHFGDKSTWTSEDPKKDLPQGFLCDRCHERVLAYICPGDNPKEIRHIRQFCGCTMVIMDASTLPWWCEINTAEAWNATVHAAKDGLSQTADLVSNS